MTQKIWDIPGGVHPPQRKKLSDHQAIRKAPLPKRLILPLQQHIGAPAMPLVNPGDKVLKGQKIADADGFVSLPLHAPSSGTVVEITAHAIPHPSGMAEPCIVIETDGDDRWCALDAVENFRSIESEDLVNRIRDAGIAGLGGAGFPSAVKLRARPEQEINTLIINGTECEPYITADDLLMQEHSEKIITGIEILCKIVTPSEVLIGVEDNKPQAIQQLQQAIKSRSLNFDVVPLPTKYPSGGEKQLIQILTGKEVPSGELPADLGIVCQNVGTVKAIHDAIITGKPLISRITTLTGEALAEPGNVDVLIGTPIDDLLTFAGAEPNKIQRLIIGGPMMGYTLHDIASPIVKTVNCVIASTAEELPSPAPAQACIRCGACSEVCPVNLLPQQLYWHSRAKDYSQLKHHNLFDCIECGACFYSCPSHIPLVQYYRASKADIRAHEAMQQKAEYSKIRFEAREARLQQIEDEKAAKRKANAERAAKLKASKESAALKNDSEAPPNDAKTEIDAAVARSRKIKDVSEDQALSTEEKALKIQRSMVNAQLKKLQRQCANCPADEQEKLERDIERLNQQLLKLSPDNSPSAATPITPATLKIDKENNIKHAMAKAAVKKTRRALAKIDSESNEAVSLRSELESQETKLKQLEITLAVGHAPPTTKQGTAADEDKTLITKLGGEEKKLKIAAAIANAALRKAERAYADAAENQTAETDLRAAEVEKCKQIVTEANKNLANISAPADAPTAPSSNASNKVEQEPEQGKFQEKNSSDELKKLKILHAMANAAVKKAQRAAEPTTQGDPGQQRSIVEARKKLDAATKALNDFTADKPVEG